MLRLRASILIFIFIVLTGFGLSRITMNVDPLALLPAHLPEVKGVKFFYEQFSRPNELIITLEGDDAESAAQSLAAEFERRPDLVDCVVWNLPLQSDSQVAADLLAYLWFNADPVQTKKLLARLAADHIELELAELIEELSTGLPDQETYMRAYDPLGLISGLPSGLESAGLDPSAADRAFASADQRFRVLYLKAPGEEAMDYKKSGLWLAEIRMLVDGWKSKATEKHPDWPLLEIAYTGEPAFVAEIGGGMEKDMTLSVTSTILLICLLFWIMHRRLAPLFWLVFMLVVTFGLTIAIASVVIGELSIMSVGFAAILIGLTIDYGVILYKEARLTPGDAPALKRLVGPSIIWAACTTAAVFFALQFSSFPGIAQLGVLVAIGVLVGSVVMLLFYSPVAARYAVKRPESPGQSSQQSEAVEASSQRSDSRWFAVTTWVLAVFSIGVLLVSGLPRFQENFKPMQLRDSPSMEATEKMQSRLSQGDGRQQPVVIAAADLTVLPGQMRAAQKLLNTAVESGAIAGFVLPDALIPNPGYQQKNRELLAALVADKKRLAAAVEKAGFNDEALILTWQIFAVWESWFGTSDGNFVSPGYDSSRWMMERIFSMDEQGRCFILGGVTQGSDAAVLEKTSAELAEVGIYLTGWNTLDPAIKRLIEGDSIRVFLPLAVALFVMLYFVFRDWRDVFLSVATLVFSMAVLLAFSSVFKIEWNAFSLSSVPILFGVGLDYSIHMIFALRRSEGNLQEVRQGIARAILFCGLSTAIGFASLSLASNLGLASIGRICGLGVLIIMLVTISLLPHWWRRLRRA